MIEPPALRPTSSFPGAIRRIRAFLKTMDFPVNLTLGLTLAVFAANSECRAQGSSPYSVPMEESSKESTRKALDGTYPDRPEWVDMLTDILQGSQLGSDDGWFRKAVAQTRFGWKATKQRLDRDGDAQIEGFFDDMGMSSREDVSSGSLTYSAMSGASLQMGFPSAPAIRGVLPAPLTSAEIAFSITLRRHLGPDARSLPNSPGQCPNHLLGVPG